jgi:hypothetical protein
MAKTYEPIATTTLGSAQSTVTFSSITGTYTDLVLICQTSVASGTLQNQIQFNSDTGTNYSATILSGDGSTVLSTRNSSVSQITLGYNDYNTTAIGQMSIVNIQNYSNTTTYKTTIQRGSNANTGVSATVGLWRSTSAITSILVKNSGGVNFAIGSTFTLYGIKAA